MRNSIRARGRVAALVTGLTIAGCGGDATGPTPGEEPVNPALEEAVANEGFAATGDGVPQGSTTFTGPGGLLMDATGLHFVQQATLKDGTVWRTSGVNVAAVPDESVVAPPIAKLRFGAALTGSLDFPGVGTYDFHSEVPPIDFVTEVPANLVTVWTRIGQDPVFFRAGSGTLTITSLEYFDDVYTCDKPDSDAFEFESCRYQLGLMEGTVHFRVETDEGEIVQEETSFAMPMKKTTLIMTTDQF